MSADHRPGASARAELRTIRLELARMPGFPEGDPACGYEFVAPLHTDGRLDLEAFRQVKSQCRVQRFWAGERAQTGLLLHLGPDRWVFSYEPGRDDDEPAFRFDRHHFIPGEYVSITEHDDVTRPFRIVSIC